MKVGIFYFSLNNGKDRQSIALPGGGRGFIRIEISKLRDICDAFDKAKPRRDEVVMNSHWLDR